MIEFHGQQHSGRRMMLLWMPQLEEQDGVEAGAGEGQKVLLDFHVGDVCHGMISLTCVAVTEQVFVLE